MVQGLVNSFGAVVMAAFAAAVKIDTIAYMPVQDFGNAFSTFVAQNYGAGKRERIRQGIRSSLIFVFFFCMLVSFLVCLFAKPLMEIFIRVENIDVSEWKRHSILELGCCLCCMVIFGQLGNRECQ